MLKKIVLIVLLLLVLGFYFFPNTTKDVVDTTAHAIKDTTKKTYDKIKNDDKIREKIDAVKENITDEISNS